MQGSWRLTKCYLNLCISTEILQELELELHKSKAHEHSVSDSAWGQLGQIQKAPSRISRPRLPQTLLLFPGWTPPETSAAIRQHDTREHPWSNLRQDREHHTKLKHWHRKKQLREKDHRSHGKPPVTRDLSWRSQWPPWACGAAKGLAQRLEVAQIHCYKARLVCPAPVQNWEGGKVNHMLTPPSGRKFSQPEASHNTGSPTAVKWPQREGFTQGSTLVR